MNSLEAQDTCPKDGGRLIYQIEVDAYVCISCHSQYDLMTVERSQPAKTELLIGCGHSRVKAIKLPNAPDWGQLTTLDDNPACAPDVVHDLACLPYPFKDSQFDEIHAYDVLEHVGVQGDWRFFFAQWSEFHRILKAGGHFCGIVPHPSSPWAFGDPSHTRIIPLEQLAFLNQGFYSQCGKTVASDFRDVWKGNFTIVHEEVKDGRQIFVLRKS